MHLYRTDKFWLFNAITVSNKIIYSCKIQDLDVYVIKQQLNSSLGSISLFCIAFG